MTQKISDIEKKITDHDHDKYITTSEFNNLTKENFKARLTQADLVTKTDFDDKLQNLNRKINSNKTKDLLVENEFKKLQKFDSAPFRGKNYFGNDGIQNYLVFQPMSKYLKQISGTNKISECSSKGISNEIINKPDDELAPTVGPLGRNLKFKI